VVSRTAIINGYSFHWGGGSCTISNGFVKRVLR
jgi:hypothetical protein